MPLQSLYCKPLDGCHLCAPLDRLASCNPLAHNPLAMQKRPWPVARIQKKGRHNRKQAFLLQVASDAFLLQVPQSLCPLQFQHKLLLLQVKHGMFVRFCMPLAAWPMASPQWSALLHAPKILSLPMPLPLPLPRPLVDGPSPLC